MIHLVKTGHVKAKQPLEGGEVEYAIVFSDHKLLAVDSKIVSTEEVNCLSDDNIGAEDRNKMVAKVKAAVKQHGSTSLHSASYDTPYGHNGSARLCDGNSK